MKYLRIVFYDNDFWCPFKKTAEEILDCFDLEKFEIFIARYGMTILKERITLSALHFYEIDRLFRHNGTTYDEELTIEQEKHYIDYFSNIDVSIVGSFNENDDNHESVYIDFINSKVYLI